MELAIRIALGAGWRDVVAAIAKRAVIQLGVGSVLGMALASLLLSVLKNVLGQASMESPVLIAALVTVAVVAVIGSLACIAPTRRALKIAPTEALADS